MDMPMRSAVPDWLTPVAWTYLSVAVLSAVFIAADIYLLRRRDDGIVTALVWITSALYLGPFAVALHLRRGRREPSIDPGRGTVASQQLAVGVLPGGGASAIAHLIGVPLVAAVGWTIAGMAMWPMIIVIAVLAIVMLAAYERVAIHGAPMRHSRRLPVAAAIVSAVITVAAFDIGMVGWMLFLNFRDAMPPVTDGTFWFLMQVGVIVGLVTGYPAVTWLLRRNQSAVPA